MANARALLVLGRVSNLSTVWSNVLCAWVLGGGGATEVFAALLVGTSLLYVGGMYLNDYCDADFDQAHRPERPIPSGQVHRRTVLLATIGLLVLGLALVAWTHAEAALYGLLLIGLIVAYNLVHKKTALGVPLMAACRLVVYLVAGAATVNGLGGEGVLAGGLMFLYVHGITSLARTESTDGSLSRMGVVGLAAAFIGVLMIGAFNGHWTGFLVAVVAMGGWMAVAFFKAGLGRHLIAGKTIGPLLAGICLVDLSIIAVMDQISLTAALTLLAFFVLALVAQRRIPAT